MTQSPVDTADEGREEDKTHRRAESAEWRSLKTERKKRV